MYEGPQTNETADSEEVSYSDSAMKKFVPESKAGGSTPEEIAFSAEQAEEYLEQAATLVDSIYETVQEHPEFKEGVGAEFLKANLKNVLNKEPIFAYSYLYITAPTNRQTKDSIRSGLDAVVGDKQKAVSDQIIYLEAVKAAVNTTLRQLEVMKRLAEKPLP